MKRLFDDPELPPELRGDLMRSRAAGHDYDALAKLPQLRAAMSDPARDPLRGDGPNPTGLSRVSHGWRVLPASWKIAALLAVGGMATLAIRQNQHKTQVRPPAHATQANSAGEAPKPSAAGEPTSAPPAVAPAAPA
ncbi:MAG: hypothetical protein ABW321_33670, partial [Polyangiales bacterium]